MSNWSTKRPFFVTLTLWIVFIIAVWNVGRVGAILRQQAALAVYTPQFSMGSRLALAVGWGILFSGLGIMLWQKRPLTRRAIPIEFGLYLLGEMGLLLLNGRSDVVQQVWLSNSLAFSLCIGYTWWALNRPQSQRYFSQKESGD